MAKLNIEHIPDAVYKEQFITLWKGLSPIPETAENTYNILKYYYAKRDYHNLNHIDHCLDEYKEYVKDYQQIREEQDRMTLAIWFHDLVQYPQSEINEEESAYCLRKYSSESQIESSVIEEACKLILATKLDYIPQDYNERLIQDIDRSIFGQPQEKYRQYMKDIRREYSWVPDDVFTLERSKILEELYDSNHIYNTAYFRSKYEFHAGQNMLQEMCGLSREDTN